MIYSSLNGYYSIRLCDNIADNDGPPELRKLAPCALYFDSAAIRPYMKHFPAGHEFWTALDAMLAQQAEASAADGLLLDIDEAEFAAMSSKKFSGAKIPVAAVRHRYPELEGSLPNWLRFVDALGGLAQFSNDFFDWKRDTVHGVVTYLSSQANRRAPGEPIESWFVREGFDWAAGELKSRFENVKLIAEAFANETVLTWLVASGQRLDADVDKVRSGVELARKFSRITNTSILTEATDEQAQ